MDLFRSLLAHLRRNIEFPISFTVRRTCKMPDENDAGRCYLYDDSPAEILVNKGYDIEMQLSTLIHELSHVLAGVKRKDHPTAFWLAHKSVYDEYLRWVTKINK